MEKFLYLQLHKLIVNSNFICLLSKSLTTRKSENKSLLKTVAPGQSAHNDSATLCNHMMDNKCVLLYLWSPLRLLESQTLCVKTPTKTIEGHPVPPRGARLRRSKINATGQERTSTTQEPFDR
ncbi:hypothetical protein DPMN_048736 [Dreissena polymorpha]|uniref:Uncharacterized protein n=1 Tax=Dreissena polymorpha TaxID=45954 RepID=A0A9D4DA46_DREPO|nr:hypothetical protein DPMN_048736 [Dreissena polymorpha]